MCCPMFLGVRMQACLLIAIFGGLPGASLQLNWMQKHIEASTSSLPRGILLHWKFAKYTPFPSGLKIRCYLQDWRKKHFEGGVLISHLATFHFILHKPVCIAQLNVCLLMHFVYS